MPRETPASPGVLLPPTGPIHLRAGPLALRFVGGELRGLRLGAREVIQRIYVAIRDENWGTVPATLSNMQIEQAEHSFRISFDAAHQHAPIDFAWRGEISGAADGTVRFSLDGAARSDFLRSRIGFCVLHPLACVGAPARITHTDGSEEASYFPQLIAPQALRDGTIQPHHPFSEMRALAHEIAPGQWATLAFAGEIFELEDQRNWIDGSFKTYGTPLRLPFPVPIAAGTRIAQSVTLTLVGADLATTAASEDGPMLVEIDATRAIGRLPRIGLGIGTETPPLDAQDIALLKTLHPAHLRVDLILADADYPAALARAARAARALGCTLEIALHCSDAAAHELAALAATVRDTAPPVGAWLVFRRGAKTTPPELGALARAILPPGAPIGGGTDAYFAELNRQRPPLGAFGMLCYSANPQVHATDDETLAAACAALADTLRTAQAFAPGTPLAVTPITLRPRFNPNATAPEPPPAPDPRQRSLFGAAWTLGCLQHLAAGGASSATFYEVAGPRGVQEGGVAFPLFHVLAAACEFGGAEVLAAHTPDPQRIAALALRAGGRLRILLANLTAEPQQVRLSGLGATARIHTLAPHALMQLDEDIQESEDRIQDSAGAG